MKLKWYFRDKPTPFFSDQPTFSNNQSWNPPAGHPNLEVFLTQSEYELLQIPRKSYLFQLTKEMWEDIRSLDTDRSVVIKEADKGSCVVVCDRDDYLSDTEENSFTKPFTKALDLMRKYSAI